MGTQTGPWQQIINNMMQPTGTLATAADPAEQKRQQDAAKLKQQRESDQMLSDHMNQLGAKPVIAGTVKDEQQVPDYSGNTASQPVTIARPADSDRTVKHKTADGDTVQWELPSEQEQIQKQAPAAAQAAPTAQPQQGTPQGPPAQSQPAGAPGLTGPPSKVGGWRNFLANTVDPQRTARWQQEQEVALQKQAQQAQLQKSFEDSVQHALDNGGKYVGPGGMIQETMTGPDGKPAVIHRPPDQDEHVAKYVDPSTGQPVQIAWPSPMNQAKYKANLSLMAAREQAQEAQITGAGAAAGVTQGKQADLEARGIPLSAEDVQRYGLPASAVGMKMLPEQLDTLSGKIVPTQIRTNTQQNIADQNNETRTNIAASNNTSRDNRQQDRINFEQQKTTRQQDLSAWIAEQRNAVAAGMSPSMRTVKLPAWDNDARFVMQQEQQTNDRQRKIFDAQDLLDPQTTPDGTRYKDPFSGAPKTMTPDLRGSLQDMINGQAKLNELQRDSVQRRLQLLNPGAALPGEAPVPKSTPVGASPNGGGATAPGAAQQHSAAATMIANYQSPERTALSRIPFGRRQAIMQEVLRMNPDYHAEYYNNFNKTESDATTGKIGTSANALNTMMGHLDVLNRAADALKSGNVQALNRVAAFIGAQTGDAAPTVYKTIVHRLGPEVTKAYLAAGGSVGERGTNEQDFDIALGPDQIKQNVGVSALLADSKIKALQDQYNRGTYGRGKQKLISDEAEAVRQRLTGQAPGNLQQSYKHTATGKNNQKVGSNDGVSWFDISTGKKVQ